MQTTVTTSEAAANLPSLIEQAKMTPVIIREGDEDVAVLYSAEEVRRQRLWRVEAFERSRNAFASELKQSLAREGRTVEDFMDELLSDNPR